MVDARSVPARQKTLILNFPQNAATAEVAVLPGDAFGSGGQGFVRIAMVENEQRIRQAIRNIAKALGIRKDLE